MIVHRAAWVLPIAGPPIRNGWVAVERGRIISVGGPSEAPPTYTERTEPDEPDEARAILPGLVNAHAHLELSWMRGRVPPAASMPAWAARVLALRRAVASEPADPIRDAINEARACGTVLVGDVTNTLASYEPLADSDLSAAVFFEQIGFSAREPEAHAADAQARLDAVTPIAWLRPSVVPHAPYSVSPGLLRAIGAMAGSRIISIHLGESTEEIQFLRDGTGSWRTLLEDLGAWNAAWTPPGCGPVEYLERAGLVHDRLLAVHSVQLTDDELRRLAAVNATVVSCPRSNAWTGAGTPPVARFYGSGVRVAVGTDSLVSVDDLNVFNEVAAMRAAAPHVPAARLLESATRIGADALGFGAELGTIEPGKEAQLIAVRLPEPVEDVEEYLVGGIEPADIRWLDGD